VEVALAEFLIGVIAVGRKYGAVTFYRKMLLPRDNLEKGGLAGENLKKECLPCGPNRSRYARNYTGKVRQIAFSIK